MKTSYSFIVNNPVVVCIATAKFKGPDGRSILVKAKGIARVNTESSDEFNAETGKKLAQLRADNEVQIKRKNFMRGYFEMITKSIKPFVIQAEEAHNKAKKALKDYVETL